MTTRLLAVLEERLSAHIALSKSRLETLALLITGMISARTVHPGHIAAGRNAPAKAEPTCRRPQRFFQQVDPGEERASLLIVALPEITGPWTLLGHAGSSSTAQRIALMKRYLSIFGAGSVKMLRAATWWPTGSPSVWAG